MILILFGKRGAFTLENIVRCVGSWRENVVKQELYKIFRKELALDSLQWEIYIHSTHLEGVKEMEKFIKYNFKDVDYLYCPYSE